jgi:hypothetical protein
MKASLGLALVVCVVLVGVFGCVRGPLSWQRITLNQPISREDVAFIVDGTTSLTDVVGRIGSPDEMQRTSGSIIARYHFADSKNFRADYGWGLRFILPFLAPELALGGGAAGTNIFQLICDPQWIVQEHAFAWHANSSEFRFWPFKESSQ